MLESLQRTNDLAVGSAKLDKKLSTISSVVTSMAVKSEIIQIGITASIPLAEGYRVFTQSLAEPNSQSKSPLFSILVIRLLAQAQLEQAKFQSLVEI